MEESNHLKIRIGPHEFEASGSAESVREQFQAFKEMVAAMSSDKQTQAQRAVQESHEILEKTYEAAANAPESIDNALPQITKVDGRIVSLTARAGRIQHAILLILLGQKIFRQNEGVTGAEIIPGLRATGGYPFARIDRTLEGMARDGDIVAFGANRGKRYRLTNKGLAEARTLAASVILGVGGKL